MNYNSTHSESFQRNKGLGKRQTRLIQSVGWFTNPSKVPSIQFPGTKSSPPCLPAPEATFLLRHNLFVI